MDQSAVGGTFRSRLSAAKLFGFIHTSRGSVEITDLGRDVIEPSRAAAARVTAFLRVPLFAALYDRFNGYALPPAAAIERQVVELGVSSKQKDRARQVFQKSANLAEFIDQTSGRFVKPATRQQEDPREKAPPSDKQDISKGGGGDGGDGDGYHPFVQGLLDELPATNEFGTWPLEDQAEWLRAAASIFKLLSKSKGRIEISAKPSKDNGSPESELP